MKSLSEYLMEALKTVKSVSGQQIESYNYDIVQVIDRKFKEGISDEDFKKFIKQDIDELFSLKENQLCKDMDKVIDDLVAKEIDRKMPEITRFAERKYKSSSARDKYIESSKEEIRQRIIKEHPSRTIGEVIATFDVTSHFDPRIFIYKDQNKGWGSSYKWSKEAIDALLDDFSKFREGAIGWTITYDAYNGTKCPKSGIASIDIKLNKETEDVVNRKNKESRDSVAAYYARKGSGGYTGD